VTGAPPHISIGRLRAVTTGTTVDVPDRVVEILAGVGPDTDVLVYEVSARSFAAVIRRTHSKQEPDLVPFIDPLEALGDELVLICQVEHGDELVTAVLRATDRTLVAATAINRSVGVVHITVQELCTRLRASDAPGAEPALEVASQCPAEERQQPGFCIVQADTAVAITAFTPGGTDVLAAMSAGGLSPQAETTEENG